MPKNHDGRLAFVERARQAILEAAEEQGHSAYALGRMVEGSCERTVRSFLLEGKDVGTSTVMELAAILGLELK